MCATWRGRCIQIRIDTSIGHVLYIALKTDGSFEDHIKITVCDPVQTQSFQQHRKRSLIEH